jgi:hypothetical protein
MMQAMPFKILPVWVAFYYNRRAELKDYRTPGTHGLRGE